MAADFPKVRYEKNHFVLTKMDSELLKCQMNGVSRHQKQFMIMSQDNEKQVYHEFEEIKEDVKEARINDIPIVPSLVGGLVPKFDIHRFVIDGPRGCDPCQTYTQELYAKERFDRVEEVY